MASQEEAVLTYSASDMILATHSNASKPNVRSRAEGHSFLSKNVDYLPNNGAILNIAQITKNVMTSATEAELGGSTLLQRNVCTSVSSSKKLDTSSPPHRSKPTTQQPKVVSKAKSNQKISMDMCFHWLRNRETLKQFRFYWRLGKLNLADYFTKHHPAKTHQTM